MRTIENHRDHAAIGVNALEWNASDTWDIADTIVGTYVVRPCNYTGQWVMVYPNNRKTGPYLSSDEAKAAAQADYEARIRSALSLPLPVQEKPVASVAEGWQLVPKEFTQAHYERMTGRKLLNLDRSKFDKWKDYWEWMLNTAPASPSTVPEAQAVDRLRRQPKDPNGPEPADGDLFPSNLDPFSSLSRGYDKPTDATTSHGTPAAGDE